MTLTLVIGNKNYSSWSMRPWLALRASNIPFDEVLIPLYSGDADKQRILSFTRSGKVPALVDGDVTVWDSLAIAEYLAERYGRYVFLTPERLDRATAFFDRHGGRIIIVARFIEGLRQLNGIIAGTARMPWRRFLVFNAIGAALWVLVWTSVGYLAGSHIDAIYRDATRYDTYLGVAAATVAVAYLAHRVVRVRRASRLT